MIDVTGSRVGQRSRGNDEMVYAYLLEEDVANGTRRILSEEVDKVEKHLRRRRNQVTVVHETRKSIKRLRALLRLIRCGMRKSQYRSANIHLRDLNRSLAQSRDLDVMQQTLSRLEETGGLAGSKTAARLRDAMNAAHAKAESLRKVPPTKQITASIGAARSMISNLDLRRVTIDVLVDGMGRSMTDFTDHYALLKPDADAEVYHEWRKVVQIHRRHLVLLSAAWPQSSRPRVMATKELSECLGYDHDLAVLLDFVSGPRGHPAIKRDVAKLREITAGQQVELRRKARAIGALLSAEAPDAFSSRVAAYWRVQRSHAGDLRVLF